MKNKILFMVINMNVGGTEKALLNMIDAMPEDKYDITILMLEEYGGFLSFIPNRVNVIYLNEYESIKGIINKPPREILTSLLLNSKIKKFLILLWLYFITTIKKDRSSLFEYLIRDLSFYSDEYDVAVAYAGPMDFISYFILRKVKAKRRIQWVHFDITKIGFNTEFASKIYPEFDNIYSVSKEANSKLVSNIPSLKEKSEVFHNLVSSHKVQEQANDGIGFTDDFNGIRILSVGRLSPEKGHDLAIKAMSKLISDGYNVRWYCIGDGSSKYELNRLIDELNIKQHFILLGAYSNPYTYMSQCDIYVQPSRYEGYCITLLEAKSLSKPIVATNVNGVKEQIKNGETGLIVDINEHSLFQAIKTIIDDQSLQKTFVDNLQREIEGNNLGGEKILEII
ncbi:glycosyltransferase [Bacillus sp. JJ1122]|uniref:glycosyltransferase n=1 Tax=Bacillus sp. JJ1122 TaxID=3122951 RepID=UPI002FFED4E0